MTDITKVVYLADVRKKRDDQESLVPDEALYIHPSIFPNDEDLCSFLVVLNFIRSLSATDTGYVEFNEEGFRISVEHIVQENPSDPADSELDEIEQLLPLNKQMSVIERITIEFPPSDVEQTIEDTYVVEQATVEEFSDTLETFFSDIRENVPSENVD